MIYTLTLNPAIDYFLAYDQELTGVQKTSTMRYLPGGKGINASIVLKNLGINNQAIIQSSGMMGEKLQNLMKNLLIDFFNIDAKGETRVNIKSNFKGETIEMNSTGEKINKEILLIMLKQKISEMKKQDTLLIMGSLPMGFSQSDLNSIVKFAFNRKIKLVFDISNDILKELVKYQPEIIKPNLKELGEMFNVKIKNKDEALMYAKKLIDRGAKRVIVSLDKSGSIYLDGKVNYNIRGVKIKEINGSGAGDSMIAAFVAGLELGLSLQETIKLAAGAGTATAASEGIAEADKINFYKNQIKI